MTVDEVLYWAGLAGFVGEVHRLERQWRSSPSHEMTAIARRAWPALRELDEAVIEEVTKPAVKALKALPDTDDLRRATAELVVLQRS